jgi:cell division protein FtsL
MTRLNIVLLIVLMGSAAYLVQASYEARRLYIAIDREEAAATELALENERLQIDRREQAAPGRTERIAVERLGMRHPAQAATRLVRLPSAEAGASR